MVQKSRTTKTQAKPGEVSKALALSPRNIIFLDMEDVIAVGEGCELDENAIKHLQHLIMGTKSELVITSGWMRVVGGNINQLRTLFAKYGLEPEILVWGNSLVNLASEIRSHLGVVMEPYRYIIISCNSDVHEHKSHLLEIDRRFGLQKQHIPKAIKLMVEQKYV